MHESELLHFLIVIALVLIFLFRNKNICALFCCENSSSLVRAIETCFYHMCGVLFVYRLFQSIHKLLKTSAKKKKRFFLSLDEHKRKIPHICLSFTAFPVMYPHVARSDGNFSSLTIKCFILAS